MNPYEIPDEATKMIFDVVSVRFADDLERGIRVERTIQKILNFVKTELKDSTESVDALEIIGEIIIEMKRRIRTKYGTGNKEK